MNFKLKAVSVKKVGLLMGQLQQKHNPHIYVVKGAVGVAESLCDDYLDVHECVLYWSKSIGVN